MSIETVLTLAVAAAILLAAATMRLVTFALTRLAVTIWHWIFEPEPAHAATEPMIVGAGGGFRRRVGVILEGARLLGLLGIAVTAAGAKSLARQVYFALTMAISGFALIGEWAWPLLVTTAHWATATTASGYRWVSPRAATAASTVARNSRSGLRSAEDWWDRHMVPAFEDVPLPELHNPMRIEEEGLEVVRSEPEPKVIRLDDDTVPLVHERDREAV